MERYTVKEALALIMESDPEPGDHSSGTSDSDTDTADEEEEYIPGPGSSSSSSTDVSDGEEMDDNLDEAWKAKNGEIHWAPTNSQTLPFNPPGRGVTPGPTRYAVSRVGELVDSFELFFTPEIADLVLKYTNLHGRRTVPDWRDLDAITIRAYFGLLLLAGVYRSRCEAPRSLWNERTGRHIFRATMSVKTFELISQVLRFDDRLTRPRRRGTDKLAAIREIWDLWKVRLPMMFNPSDDICVDEQLVPYRGRCQFRQYMPKKPGRYGLKCWVTCDVKTSYAWRVAIYTGRSPGEPAERNQGHRVVLEMTEGLRGVTVTCDNFFSSYALSEELQGRKIAMVGTMRKNRKELPPELLKTKREVFSSLFAFSSRHTLVSYIPKRHKNVILLSSRHRAPEVSSGEKKKPQIILDYNRCKGGVDTMDKMVSTYSCRRRTRRWPLALFHNILDISGHNAYILWVAIEPAWNQGKTHRRRLFLEELGQKLVAPQIARRKRLPQAREAAKLVLEVQADSDDPRVPTTPSHQLSPHMRRQCALCPTRRVVSCTCKKCGNHVCKEHYSTICSSCLP